MKRDFLLNNNIFFKGYLISAEENLLLSELAALNAKMLLSGDLNLYHKKRKNFIALAKQIFKSGAGRLEISLLYPKTLNGFTFLPLLGLLFCGFLLIFLPTAGVYLCGLYLLISILFVFKGFWLYKRISIAIMLFLIFPVIHLSYAFGNLFGVLSVIRGKTRNK